MAWTTVIRADELETFGQCRRAWDLGSLSRQRWASTAPFDFLRAVREALAVYYFPAMDDWPRAIPRQLAMKGFVRSMHESRATGEAVADMAEAQAQVRSFEEHLEVGKAMLANYFAWAGAEMDDFDSILADYEIWTPVPDPDQPGTEIGLAGSRPVRYLGLIDQLIGDTDDEFWIVQHRVVSDGWADNAELLADDLSIGHCWAMQVSYPQMLISGTIINELRTDGQLEVEPPAEIVERDQRNAEGGRHPNVLRSPLTPEERRNASSDGSVGPVDHMVFQQDNGLFRRTVIRRSQASMARMGLWIADEIKQTLRADLEVPPTFSDRCPRCEFATPCAALEAGDDPEAILQADFVRRDEDSDTDNLRRSKVRGDRQRQSGTVNFRWG